MYRSCLHCTLIIHNSNCVWQEWSYYVDATDYRIRAYLPFAPHIFPIVYSLYFIFCDVEWWKWGIFSGFWVAIGPTLHTHRKTLLPPAMTIVFLKTVSPQRYTHFCCRHPARRWEQRSNQIIKSNFIKNRLNKFLVFVHYGKIVVSASVLLKIWVLPFLKIYLLMLTKSVWIAFCNWMLLPPRQHVHA